MIQFPFSTQQQQQGQQPVQQQSPWGKSGLQQQQPQYGRSGMQQQQQVYQQPQVQPQPQQQGWRSVSPMQNSYLPKYGQAQSQTQTYPGLPQRSGIVSDNPGAGGYVPQGLRSQLEASMSAPVVPQPVGPNIATDMYGRTMDASTVPTGVDASFGSAPGRSYGAQQAQPMPEIMDMVQREPAPMRMSFADNGMMRFARMNPFFFGR